MHEKPPATRAGREPMRMGVSEAVVLWYRVPAEAVAHHLPPGLELVTRGRWAFWNVVHGRFELPGQAYDSRLMHRLFVQAMDERAELLQGLFTVRQVADDAAPAPVSSEPACDWARDSCFPSRLDVEECLPRATCELTVVAGRLTATRFVFEEAAWQEVQLGPVAAAAFPAELRHRELALERATRLAPLTGQIVRERRQLLDGGPLQHTVLPRRVRRPTPTPSP